jgi:type VI secretion system protein ImpH
MNIKQLIEDPSEYDFYQAIYTIERQLAAGKEQQSKVGHDSIPKNELIRFISDQKLGYPGAPISKIEKRKNIEGKTAYDLHVSFMGVTGTNGALPQHYTELVLERLKYKDTGMRDFFDLFNHRLLSLYYRAWEKYKFPIAFEKYSESSIDSFSSVLNQLSGTSLSAGKYYAGFLNHSIRNVEGLKQILMDFTGCKVDIDQFQGKWQMLSEADQTRLGQRSQPEGQFAQLGFDACIGNKIWDINSDIKIVIKPSEDAQIEKFLSGGSINLGMKGLINQYLGRTIHHKLQLELINEQIPVTRLSKNSIPLGKGGGLASRDSILKNKTTIYL